MLMHSPIPDTEQLEGDSDQSLLQRYATAGDRAALGELVRRYAGMVYAAACRQTRDAAMADDVVQNVFVIFARRAAHIRSAAAIPTWLLRTTHYTAANMMKTEIRRKRYERAASDQRSEVLQNPVDEDRHWETLSPLIDGAIARLNPADQTAVVLRFFRGLSLRDLADATGTTEEAARKRVSRAIDKLRQYLIRAGAPADACTPLVIPALLGSRAIGHAPPAVISKAVAAALNGKAAGIAIGSALGAKFAITGIIVLIAAAATVVKVTGLLQVSGGAPAPATQPEATEPEISDWEKTFYAAYGLKPDENIKYLVPPFIPERDFYFQDVMGPNFRMPQSSDKLSFIFDGLSDGTVKWRIARNLATRAMAVRSLVAELIPSLRNWQLQGDDSVLALKVPGDWVVRPGASPEQVLPAIETAIQQALGRNLKFTRESVDKDVIVISGTSKPGTNRLNLEITKTVNHKEITKAICADAGDLAEVLSDAIGLPVLGETDGRPFQNALEYNGRLVADTGQAEDDFLADLIQSVSDQSGLTLKREHRKVDIWTLGE
jgi:RNA polymerase sigma factor (sigma-70 family)